MFIVDHSIKQLVQRLKDVHLLIINVNNLVVVLLISVVQMIFVNRYHNNVLQMGMYV